MKKRKKVDPHHFEVKLYKREERSRMTGGQVRAEESRPIDDYEGPGKSAAHG